MPIDTKLSKLEKILDLAKKQGASEVEVLQKSWCDNPVNFENNKLKSLESNESSGISVRLIKNKKIGLASSTDPDALENIAEAAIESSEYGAEATFEFSKEKFSTGLINQTPPEIPLESLIERGTQVIESMKPFHKDLLISGGFNLGHGETIYLNSNNVNYKKSKSVFSTSFYAQLIRNEDFLGIYEGNSSLDDFPGEKEISNIILEKLNHSREIILIETKKYPVIFTPRAVASIFANILSVMLNGKAIQQKISPLTDKLNQKLFDKKFSLMEDPNIGIQKTDLDDEGIKTTKKDLIKNGIVNSFYFDLASASKIGLPKHISTGNGFKPSLSSPPSPMLTSLVIEGGKTPHNDIVKNINEGIFVDQLLGAGQSNTLAGEFSVGIDLGFIIKEGKIKGRIKNCMIAGNIFEVLKNITEISSNREWIDGAYLFPYFLIDQMMVGARG